MSHERDPKDAAWTIAFDPQGNDLALQAELAAMSDDHRARTDQNVRAFIDAVRPTLRVRGRSEDEQRVLAERLLETVEGDPVLAGIAAAPVVDESTFERSHGRQPIGPLTSRVSSRR